MRECEGAKDKDGMKWNEILRGTSSGFPSTVRKV